jgi:hypothetical protein
MPSGGNDAAFASNTGSSNVSCRLRGFSLVLIATLTTTLEPAS